VDKILFRVDAQPEIGFGHLYRCIALARMLDEYYDISFAMGKADSAVRQLLSEAGYRLILLQSFDYIFPDKRENEEVNFDISECISDFNLVVLDGYWFGPKYQAQLRTIDKKVVIIEDKGSGNYKADVLINPAEGLSGSNYIIDNEKAKRLLGSKYALLRESFLKAVLDKRVVDKKRANVLICFGGSDILNKTLEVTKWFLDNTSENVRVVIGNAYPYIQSLQVLLVDYEGRLVLRRGIDDKEMVLEMTLASLGVVPASGILLECIACRLPVISGVYAENQLRNFVGLLNHEVLFSAKNFLPAELQVAWDLFQNDKGSEMIKRQCKLIDGKSSERIRKIFNNL
jgi:UDP-2,4-diacetamido-2,4,6-trideoxy-beta-L-altropyranose hydrolase